MPVFAIMLLAISVLVLSGLDFMRTAHLKSKGVANAEYAILAALADLSNLDPGTPDPLSSLPDAIQTFFEAALTKSQDISIENISINQQPGSDNADIYQVSYDLALGRLLEDSPFILSKSLEVTLTGAGAEAETTRCTGNVDVAGGAFPLMTDDFHTIGWGMGIVPPETENYYKLHNGHARYGAIWHKNLYSLSEPFTVRALAQHQGWDLMGLYAHIYGPSETWRSLIEKKKNWAYGAILWSYGQPQYRSGLALGTFYGAHYSQTYSLNTKHVYNGSMARAKEYYELTLSWDPMSSTMSYTYRGQGGSEVIDPTVYFGNATHVRVGLFGAAGGYPGLHAGCLLSEEPGDSGETQITISG